MARAPLPPVREGWIRPRAGGQCSLAGREQGKNLNGEPHNPKEDPGLQKRLILVFALTFVIILATQPLLRKFAPQLVEPPKQAQQPNQPGAGGGQPAAASGAQGTPSQPSSAASSQQPAGSPAVKQAAAESEVVVENDLYKITFTNRGAQVKSWILKKYTNDQGKPLELVNHAAAEKFGYPLSFFAYDEALRSKLNSALYVPSDTTARKAPAEISFEYSDGDLAVRKSFHFDHSYVVKIETEVIRGGRYLTAYPAWPAGFGDQTNATAYAGSRVDYQVGDKVERLEPKKVPGGGTVQPPFYWAGPLDQYFAALFLPAAPERASLVLLHNELAIPEDLDKPDPNKTVKVPVLGAAVGTMGGQTTTRLFVGPKAIDVLNSIRAAGNGPDIEGALDWGFFGFIARPLFLWLKWTHDHWVPNWGWAIVLLTVIINVALFPLRLSSMKSAMKMQRIAPQVKALQEKYKKFKLNDPRRQEQNQELAALYKQHGVNPVGGCFPMLLQMPFLFAFYSMLANATELRHAPWLWISDLAAPSHVLAIAIIVTMFLTTKLTPQAGMDPVQQKMMMVMMPVMLGVISWNLAAGLGLYWAVGNLLAIIQQLWMNQTEFGRQMRAHAEERARKPRK